MSQPTPQELFDAIDATWSAEQFINHAGWCIRKGAGGGKRVSAATLEAPFKDVDIVTAEQKMQFLNQKELFMIRPSDTKLDTKLEQFKYDIVDPVVLLASPVKTC